MPTKKTDSMPYPPSWMDRLVDYVERLPIPSWLFYILFFIAIELAVHGLMYLSGSVRFPDFEPSTITGLIWGAANIAIFHYLRASASLGIDGFRQALSLNDREFALLKYRFTVTPARTGWIFTALTLIFLVWNPEPFRQLFNPIVFGGLTALLTRPLVWFMYSFFLTAIVRSVQTLILAGKMYSQVKVINLFNLNPLYGISVFLYRMGLMTVGAASLTLITTLPFFTGDRAVAGNIIFFFLFLDVILGLSIFIFPLMGLHRRLVAEKQRVAIENDDRLNKAFWELQRRVDKGQLKGIFDLRTSVGALMDFRQEIKRLSTWPWDGATLRTFITALLVPMSVWIVQQVLLRTVAK